MTAAAWTPPLTERLNEALREGRLDGFDESSPHARCLLPLLRALGHPLDRRQLIEAMPHFSDTFDLVDLRNLMVVLGFESERVEASLGCLKSELLPCLFETPAGETWVVLEIAENGEYRYFDAADGEEHTHQGAGKKGVVYLFTDVSAEDTATDSPWSTRLWLRFRGLIIHLLAMNFLINTVAIVVPLAVMLIYDKVIGTASISTLPYVVAGVGIALAGDFGFRQLRARLLGNVAGRLDYVIGVEAFRQLMQIPPIYTERSSVAAQLARLRQFDSVRSFFTGSGASVALELPFAIIAIGVIALLAGPVAWVPIGAILIYVLLGLIAMPQLDELQKQSAGAKAEKQRLLLQTVQGHIEIKSQGVEPVWLGRFRQVSGETAHAAYRAALGNAVSTAFGQAVMAASALGVIGWGTHRVLSGDMSVGALIASMALVWRVLGPLQSAYLTATKAQQIFKSLKQINQLMKIPVEKDSASSRLLLSDVQGRIAVDRLSFRYGPDQDPAVFNVSFSVAPGEIVAVTGTTGSGKSTVLKLIAGMYRAQAGTVRLDRMDIRQMDPGDLRRSIAYVPQEIQMFHGTIAQNLRLSNGLATEQELQDALREAGVLDDVLAMPRGLDTRIGDNVTDRYPPGFVRGLGLARALLRKTHVILLDEPGASLDMPSDNRLVESLRRMRGQRTVVLVTHRPSHIRLADRAVIMDKGAVKFVGSPQAVIERMLGGKP